MRVADAITPDGGAQWLAARRIDEPQFLFDLLHADTVVIDARVVYGVGNRHRLERPRQGVDELGLASRIEPVGGIWWYMHAGAEHRKSEKSGYPGRVHVHGDSPSG